MIARDAGNYLIQTMVTLLLTLSLAFTASAQTSSALTDVGVSSLPGNRVLIKMSFDAPAPEPLSFTIDNPARIALDFKGVANKLDKKSQPIGVSVARSMNVVEAKGRTRVVLNLARLVPYKWRVEGNEVYVTLESPTATAATPGATIGKERAISNMDFRRGKSGEGRITVTLTDATAVVDVEEVGDKIVVTFADTKLPKNLEQRLDVVDFATPVVAVDTYARDNNVRMEVLAEGLVEHLAYQSDKIFSLEVKPVSEEEQERVEKERFGYTGEKLSLNFQNIEVRAVLQLIADFTGFNLVASDTVSGNVTLRLKNVPWDQALDIVLRTKGLGMRQVGNVMLVAPAEEIAAREKADLESKRQIEELEPLHTELIQVNYAKADDISKLLTAEGNAIVTERGSVSIDARTNTLLVLETTKKLEEVRALVNKLDIPIRQVLIESRIVIASNDFSRDLGVKFGVTGVDTKNDGMIGITGSTAGTDTMIGSAITNIQNNGNAAPVTLPSVDDRLAVNLPVAAAGQFALGILDSDFLLDLELTAMQQEGRGEVLSNPRVITANQNAATIEQGVEIPYQEASSSGATSVSFKKAVLGLSVTPQITPDDRVIMKLNISKDSVGAIFNGVPSIDTREIDTQVLVANGETVVLGGIYEQEQAHGTSKVPFLGDLPVVGRLFRNDNKTDNKEELLIFITPKILKEDLRF
jgi:type IV pilus assembly protein PilQ